MKWFHYICKSCKSVMRTTMFNKVVSPCCDHMSLKRITIQKYWEKHDIYNKIAVTPEWDPNWDYMNWMLQGEK